MRISHILKYRVAVLSCLGALLLSTSALAHCDSMDGPVIRDAQAALEKRDPTPVLKWVTKDREGEVREAFQRALAVRAKGDDAKQLADHYFFETLVRTHRAGEGEAYTGLKPSGNIDPGAAAADRALELGASQELAKEISEAVKDGIAKRFATALELRKHAGDSVEAGRAYVEAYVDYVHFIENINRLAVHGASHSHHEPSPHSPDTHK